MRGTLRRGPHGLQLVEIDLRPNGGGLLPYPVEGWDCGLRLLSVCGGGVMSRRRGL